MIPDKQLLYHLILSHQGVTLHFYVRDGRGYIALPGSLDHIVVGPRSSIDLKISGECSLTAKRLNMNKEDDEV